MEAHAEAQTALEDGGQRLVRVRSPTQPRVGRGANDVIILSSCRLCSGDPCSGSGGTLLARPRPCCGIGSLLLGRRLIGCSLERLELLTGHWLSAESKENFSVRVEDLAKWRPHADIALSCTPWRWHFDGQRLPVGRQEGHGGLWRGLLRTHSVFMNVPCLTRGRAA